MANYDDLQGKTILVNGGTKGIGLEIVLEFLKNGCRLICTGRTAPENFQLLGKLQQEYGAKNLSYYVVDSSNPYTIKVFMNSLIKKVKKVNVLVNNSAFNSYSEISNLDYEIATQIVNTNFFGYLHFMTETIPLMDSNDGGSIINMSSIVAYRAFKGRGIYAATKAAIDSLTRSAALEFSHMNIRINSVCAGTVLTSMVERTLNQSGNPEAEESRLISRIPLRRFGKPVDIARVVKFLASDDSAYMTGTSIFVDGGVSAGFTE